MEMNKTRKDIGSMELRLTNATGGVFNTSSVCEAILLLFVLDSLLREKIGLFDQPEAYLNVFKGLQEAGEGLCIRGDDVRNILDATKDPDFSIELSEAVEVLDKASNCEETCKIPEFQELRKCPGQNLFSVLSELIQSTWLDMRTSSSVSKIASELLDVNENDSFCDFFCGCGQSSASILEKGCKHAVLNDISSHNLALSKCMARICGISNVSFVAGDGLCLNETGFDRMFLDSPLKVRLPKPFEEGITDLCSAGILKAISMLSENGLAVSTVMSSFLYLHSGSERRVRDYLIENRLIKGIISLPSNMKSFTGINTSILLLSKEKNESIFMVDLSSEKAEIYSYYDRNEHVRHINDEGLRIISDAAKGSGFERFVSFSIDYKDVDHEENVILPSRYCEKEEKPVRAIGEIDSEIADCFRALAALTDEFVTN